MERMRQAAIERAEKEATQILEARSLRHENGHHDAFYRKRYKKECWEKREQSRAGPLQHRSCTVEHNGREHDLSWAYRSDHEASSIAVELIEQLGLYPSALSGHFLLQVEEKMNIPSTYYLKYDLGYWRPFRMQVAPFRMQVAAMRAFLEKAGAWRAPE